MSQLPVIPADWALRTTNVGSEWVEQQFLAHIADRPLVEPPPELDAVALLSCGQLALLMVRAYQHPSVHLRIFYTWSSADATASTSSGTTRPSPKESRG
jgi:hypothetical protein